MPARPGTSVLLLPCSPRDCTVQAVDELWPMSQKPWVLEPALLAVTLELSHHTCPGLRGGQRA